MLTTLAHPSVQNLSQNFVGPGSRNWIVLDELDRTTKLADKRNGLNLGYFGHDAGLTWTTLSGIAKEMRVKAEHILKRTALLCC
jgi:hypothetical protein